MKPALAVQASRSDLSVADSGNANRTTAIMGTLRKLGAPWLLFGIMFVSAAASAQTTASASPTAVAVGGTVTAGWSNVTSPSSSNFFVIAVPGGATVPGSRSTGSAATSGSVPFVLPTSLAQGTYELRLFTPSSVLLAISNSFTVGPPVTVSGTTTASGAVLAGVNFTASNGGTCTTSNSSGQYSCTVLQGWSGTITPSFSGFTMTPASRDYTNVAANTTAQNYDASSTSQLVASPTAIAVGGTLTASWSNATPPPSGNFLLGIAVPGGGTMPGLSSTGSAATSGSAPFTQTSFGQGTYQLRLFTPTGVLLAISNSFTIGPPVTVSGTATASGAVLAGVSFAATNGGTCTTSNSSGQYSCTVLQGWSGTITPSFSGFTMTPASRDYTNVAANTTAQNYVANSTSQ
ncbi:MAG TPA: hypothetical protein VK572_01505, partial [Burkholderiales bacterium]|nr:hypothetical protein [Burkholderiales bacterium]